MGNNTIGFMQLTAIILLCRLSDILFYIKDIPAGVDGYNALLSTAFTIVFNFVAAMPIYLLSRKNGGISLDGCINKITPHFGKVVCGIYALILMFFASVNINHTTVAIDELFIDARYMSFLLVLVILSVFYCVLKGVTALGRASFILSIATIISILAIFVLCLALLKNAYIEPIFINGSKTVFKTALINLSQFGEILIFATLLSNIKEKRFKTLMTYSVLSLAFSLLIIFTVSSVYGSYTTYETFPFFSAIGLTNSGLLRRTDSLFICLWVTLSAVKSAAYEICAVKFIKKILPNHSLNKIVGICAVTTTLLCLIIHRRILKSEYILNNAVLLIIYIVTVFAVPLIYLITNMISGRKHES